jgi:hypothetical protein
VERSKVARHRIFSLPFSESLPLLPFPPSFFQLPLKRILSKFAHIFSGLIVIEPWSVLRKTRPVADFGFGM